MEKQPMRALSFKLKEKLYDRTKAQAGIEGIPMATLIAAVLDEQIPQVPTLGSSILEEKP